MPRVALDASYIFGAYPTGSATYSRRLIESVAEANTRLSLQICYRVSRFRHRREFLRPAGTSTKLITFALAWNTDLFHSLAQRPPSFRFKREVVTIHDIFPITNSDYSTTEYQKRFSGLLREAVARSARILTGSEFTASQLQDRCGVPRDKIRVIPYGVDMPEQISPPGPQPSERARFVGEGNHMLLMVGMLERRKNLINALTALELLPPSYHLVHAGGDGYGSEAIHDFIRRRNLASRVHLLGYVSSETLRSLYRSASTFMLPSLEEGFGLPVLEGMAWGLPVVASNTSSIPEVGGDAALYFDPRQPEEIASRVLQATEDESLRQDRIARGRKRAAEFTWKRTAEKTLSVYEELL